MSEDGGEPALQQKENADFQSTYDFKTWEDAMEEYGPHLVGLEYEQVKKEGSENKMESARPVQKPFALSWRMKLQEGYLKSITRKISTLS